MARLSLIALLVCAAVCISAVYAGADCPSGYKKVAVKKYICTPKCSITRRRGSLAFTIDDTGSMWREINAVKTHIARIVRANRRFKDYVIGTFNDPYRRNVIRSRSASTILNFLRRVRARRGGDCPEYAMRGIIDAARLARPHSVLFVVTDASAKDARLKHAVARYLRSKKIRLFAVKVGRMCGRRYRREFEFLAKQTGGRVLRFRRRANFRYLMRFIKNAVHGQVAFNSMPNSGAQLRRLRSGCCKWKTISKCVKDETIKECPADHYKLEETVRECKCRNGTDQTRPPPRAVGSLAFTIDDTGSMWREINAVKTHIARIVRANRRFKDYVIGTFNDPYKRNVIRSRSASTILNFLRRVRARRGGDCPEYAMRGIIDAARLARPRSVLFVVTDASAKDARLKHAVARYLRSKKIRLFAVKVGRMCGRRYQREFEFLAKQTGGRVLQLRNRNHFRYVLSYIGHASRGEASFTSMPSSENQLRAPWKPECICKLKTVVRCVTRCPDGYERVDDTCVKPR